MDSKIYDDSQKIYNLITFYIKETGGPKRVYVEHNKVGFIMLVDSSNEVIHPMVCAFFNYVPCYLQMISVIAKSSGLCENVGELTETDDHMQIELTFKED